MAEKDWIRINLNGLVIDVRKTSLKRFIAMKVKLERAGTIETWDEYLNWQTMDSFAKISEDINAAVLDLILGINTVGEIPRPRQHIKQVRMPRESVVYPQISP